MNTRARHAHIDAIKALATIIVMITHVLAYHLGEYTTWFLWNYSHFVVVGLVFSSAYLYADSHPTESTRLTLSWFFKRFSRLYIPYLIYLIVHSALMFFFPYFFIGYGWQKSISFFIQNLTLFGGVDFGWLPLLFIQLALILPVLLRISRNSKNRTTYFIGMCLFVLITTFVRIPNQYSRLIAWLPWSLIAFLGLYYSDAQKRNPTKAYILLSRSIPFIAGIWISLRVLLLYFNMPTSFDMHKYPPDMSYLSYGAFFTAVFLMLLTTVELPHHTIKRIITYVSKQSYQLFFIHFMFLDLVMTRFRSNWLSETLIVVVCTVCTSLLIRTIALRLRKLNNISG